MDEMRQHILSIFLSGVKFVLPRQLIKDNLQITNGVLNIANQLKITLNNNLHVIGLGKAALSMTSAVEDCLHQHIAGGVISIPIGTQNNLKQQDHLDCLLRSDSKIEIFEGANDNLPDENSLHAAKRIIAYLKKLDSQDIILVLISGGGSALLPSPIPPVTLEDKLKTIQLLTSKGATIQQLNIVRKQLSSLKGGGLARLANSSRIISLILSDIIGDPIDLIASGPTLSNSNNADDALEILDEFYLRNSVPHSVLQLLTSKSEKPLMLTPLFNVTNIVIGNNAVCLAAAESVAESLGYAAIILSSELDGEAKKCGEFLALLAYAVCVYFKTGELDFIRHISSHDLFRKLSNRAQSEKLPVCILCGGETTVIVNNKDGVGGRNQELVLSSSIFLDELFRPELAGFYNVFIFSAGTDGIDGPTNAAGAITDAYQKSAAKNEKLEVEKYLENNDSNTFYKSFNSGSDLIMTGHTGTNVMDIQIVLIAPV
uniref:Glycerate kinase n=1 Tax=Strigamia maritima TaxID=126957 RepID=T1IKW8_STRMM